MTTLTICTNGETLADGDYRATEADLPELCRIAASGEIIGLADDDDVTVETDSIFSHWHGGKFDQFGRRCGFVHVSDAGDKHAIERAHEMDAQICGDTDEYLEKVEEEG